MAKSLPIEKWFEDITLLSPTETTDSWGQKATGYSETTIQGKLRKLNGNEANIADKMTEISTHRLYTFSDNITTKHRIKFNNKIYNVITVNDVMNFNRLIQVDCKYEE